MDKNSTHEVELYVCVKGQKKSNTRIYKQIKRR